MAPKVNLKTPKGTRDWSGPDILLRRRIFDTISSIFRAHGGEELDTPVFELKDLLMGNYGEDSKLIYDLQDQGGELCSLRYDLTVPLARYCAMNPDKKKMKRYVIAKVYRRDQPAMSKGRMREFYQCDFDIAGAASVIADSEVIGVVGEVFEALGWQGRYTIKINNRKILDGVFEVCGVPSDKMRSISSAVDKLDKIPWSDVRKEMVEEKGLSEDAADRIEQYVTLKGGKELAAKLEGDEKLMQSDSAKKGIEEMKMLMEYLEAWKVLDKISFDMSLARGLDYYTGVIYEVVTEGSAPVAAVSEETEQTIQKRGKKEKKKAAEDDDRSDDPTVGVGSVAAGGRYDNLVDRFLRNARMPCVGVSFGVDRIFSIEKARLEREGKLEALRATETDVYVMAFGGKGFDGMGLERVQIWRLLLEAGIKADSSEKLKSKLPAQFEAADAAGAPLAVILGEDEWKQGKVRVKEMGLPDDHPEKNGIEIEIDKLAVEVKKKLALKAETIGEIAEIVGATSNVKID